MKTSPCEFINSYRNIQQRLKSAETKFEAELTDKLKTQSTEFIDKFVKIVQELCDDHVYYPFMQGRDLYYSALHKLGLK